MNENNQLSSPITLSYNPLLEEGGQYYSNNFDPTVILKEINVRKMTKQDLQQVMWWAANERWNPGLYEIDALYAADPKGYYLLEIDNKPVASLAIVRYAQQFAFLGLYIVEPAHRKQGYGKLLWDSVMRNITDCSIGLNSVSSQVEQYKKEGFSPANTNTRWQGNLLNAKNLPIEVNNPITLQKPDSITPLIDYNAHLFPAPRAAFLSQWLIMPYSHVLAAFEKDKLCGYGVISKTSEGYKIAPLLADNQAIAQRLYLALCRCIRKDDTVYIDTSDTNPDASDLMQKLGLKQCFETVRMYKGQAFVIEDSKWFGLNSLEIG